MLAYKAFNKDLTCTLGKGTFQYKEGVLYKEERAKAQETGFHCCENPLDILRWYPDMEKSVYYKVDAGGSVNEDGYLTRISCTQIMLIQRMDMYEFVEESIKYMFLHPLREWSEKVQEERAAAEKNFAIARGKAPKAKGKPGTVIAVVKEHIDSPEIEDYAIFIVGEKGVMEDTWYGINGEEDADEERGAKEA